MSSKLTKMAFSKKLEKIITNCSKEDLGNVLRRMAYEQSPTQRAGFLNSLREFKNKENTLNMGEDFSLLDDIESLREEIEHSVEEEYEEYWQDDDQLGPFEQFLGPFAQVLDRAENAFECGEMELAYQAYQKLFEIEDIESDYGHSIDISLVPEVDSEEVKTRFVRAKYCLTTNAKRPEEVFGLMQSMCKHTPPTLSSLVEISSTPPPDWEEFLENSIQFLKKKKDNVSDLWLREAILLSGGVQAIAKLARSEGKQRPKAFINWLENLDGRGDPYEIIKVCKLAFKTIEANSPVRAFVADRLEEAAEAAGDEKLAKSAMWEGFLAKPELSRLIKAKQSNCPMGKAKAHVESFLKSQDEHLFTFEESHRVRVDSMEDQATVSQIDLVHSNIFAGDWKSAFKLAKKEKCLGWRGGDSPTALFVVLSLVKTIDMPFESLPENLSKAWCDYGSIKFYRLDSENKLLHQIESVYKDIFQSKQSSFLCSPEVQKWLVKSVESRVEHIVSNNHRRAYERAALIAGAYCETLEKTQGIAKARAWAAKIRGWFPRHSAFQREVKNSMYKYC